MHTGGSKADKPPDPINQPNHPGLPLSLRFPPSKWGTEELSNLACHHRFRDCIEAQDPDLIISVHPLCQDVPLRVLNTIGDGTYVACWRACVPPSLCLHVCTHIHPSVRLSPSQLSLSQHIPPFNRRKIPFVTVVTDLGGAHPTWFHKEVDLCFVPSDPVRRIALSMGLKPDQLRQHGLPIRCDIGGGYWWAKSVP